VGIKLDQYSTLPYFTSPNVFSGNTHGIEIYHTNYVYVGFNDYMDQLWNPAIGGIDCWVYTTIYTPANAGWAIAPGNVFKFENGTLYVQGPFNASGTENEKIVFTSTRSTPVPGDWTGIDISSTDPDSVVISNCIIEYAANGVCNRSRYLRLDSSSVYNCLNHGVILNRPSLIKNCDLSFCTYGVQCINNSILNYKNEERYPFEIANTKIRNNQTGIMISNVANPRIYNCAIYDNSDYAVYNNLNNYWINAENNWWGDSTGPRDTSSVDTLYNPFGLGNRVSDHVDYEPWLGYPIGIKEDQTKPIDIPAVAFIQASPNPFRSVIALAYSSDPSRPIRIKIFNCLGQLVTLLENNGNKSGQRIIYWNGKDMRRRPVQAGIYWCRIESDKPTEIKKIIKVE
jgi:hypothetical protein